MKKIYVDPIASIGIMFGTVAIIFATGAIAFVFSSSYERSCTPDSTGKHTCTQSFKFGGWGAIPLQGIAGAIGTGFGIYAAVKSGKLPGMRSEEGEGDIPS